MDVFIRRKVIQLSNLYFKIIHKIYKFPYLKYIYIIHKIIKLQYFQEHLAEFVELKGTMDRLSRWQMELKPRMLIASPWLRHLPFFWETIAEFNGFQKRIYDYLGQQIEARIGERKKLETKKEAADLLDCFLDQMEMAKNGELDEEAAGEFTCV